MAKKNNKMKDIDTRIFFYDGDCGMCNEYVVFMLNSNPKESLKFASLNSEIKKKLIGETQIDSAIFYDNGDVYYKSSAIINSIKYTNSFLRFLHYLKLIPSFITDKFYDIIAANRKLILKKRNQCVMLTFEQKKLFLE